MSDFGEEIIERLPSHSALRKEDNSMRKVIDYTIGEWLQQHHDNDWFSQFFLNEATGKYLDLHGKEYGLTRRINESDESFRKRIIYETLGHLTLNFLKDVYGVEVYLNRDDFDVDDNTLVSDNPYLTTDLLIVTDSQTQAILNKKFVLDSNVRFVQIGGV